MAGIIDLGYVYRRHPQTVTKVGLARLGEPAADPVATEGW